jgi:hypothetical protein
LKLDLLVNTFYLSPDIKLDQYTNNPQKTFPKVKTYLHLYSAISSAYLSKAKLPDVNLVERNYVFQAKQIAVKETNLMKAL